MNCRHVCKNTEEIATARGSELKLGHVLGLPLSFLGMAGKGGQKGLSESQEVTNEMSAP